MVNGLPAMSNSGLCGEKLNLTGILLGILLCSCLLQTELLEPKALPIILGGDSFPDMKTPARDESDRSFESAGTPTFLKSQELLA